MASKPTQKQLQAQGARNYGLFEAPEQSEARRAQVELWERKPEVVAEVQLPAVLSELPAWHEIKRVAAGTHARSGFTQAQHLEANSASFGAEAGTLRNVARCDADGVCL